MIEKVARVLYSSFEDNCSCNRCIGAKADAKAAIEAMRIDDPTHPVIMSTAGFWNNGIDAALKE